MTVRVVTTGDTFALPGEVLTRLDTRYTAASVGLANKATGTDAVAIGPYATAIGDSGVVIGSGAGDNAAGVAGGRGVALGYGAKAEGENGVAIGAMAEAFAANSTCLGSQATASGRNSIGINGAANADNSLGILGYANALGSTAIGADSTGTLANADVQDEMMLGTALTTVHAGKDVKTLQPSSNGNPAWQLGAVVATAATVDATRYVEVMIGGQLVKLAVCQ